MTHSISLATQRGSLSLQRNKIALLVVDMQCYFSRIIRPIVNQVESLISLFHENKLPVLFTQHGHQNPKEDAGMMAEWWDDHIIEGSKNWEIDPRLPKKASDTILRKRRYNAFHGTRLDSVLKKKKVSTIFICGIMTNVCCETTAREAFCKDYRVVFVQDATNAASRRMHDAAILNLGYAFAYIVSATEVLKRLSTKLPRRM
jgi:nicotinamidase-related amidase